MGPTLLSERIYIYIYIHTSIDKWVGQQIDGLLERLAV